MSSSNRNSSSLETSPVQPMAARKRGRGMDTSLPMEESSPPKRTKRSSKTNPLTKTRKARDTSPTRKMDISTPAAAVGPKNPLEKLPVGDVFVVGSGDCGQLGLGQDVLEKERPALLQYFKDKDIVAIKAGGLHNMALSRSGKLYSWGCNDQCALGRSGEETEPAPVQGLDHEMIVSVACGDSVSAALTEDGRVYTWGTFRDNNGIFGLAPGVTTSLTPRWVPELKHIVQIEAGANHLVAVSREGGYHTFMVHESGSVYAFGLNNHGQLGVGSTDETDGPEPVEELDGSQIKIVALKGGEHHSLALDSTGRVWVWGRGDSGQLGLGEQDSFTSPQLLKSLSVPIKQISAGGAFSIAVSTDSGSNVYGWGYGEMGQLANESEDAPEPHRMNLKDRVVYDASAGGQHTLMLLNFKE